jgi:predicted alpha/beta hydrolase family esterase
VCSDEDPYCPEGAADTYGAPLRLPVDRLHALGHINPEAGLGPFPAVEAWCLRGEVPIVAP